MRGRGLFFVSAVSGLAVVVLIALLRLTDVAPIGPEGTGIGLSHLNKTVFDTFGVNLLWYKVTEGLGILAILIALVFAVVGIVQLIKRKSIFKIDREILALGCLYILLAALYVFFEKVTVNFRPIIMPDNTAPEASFPSSHTMLICVIMGSVIILMQKYVKQAALCRVLRIICFTVICITVTGRLLSGVHWFTDILGGILISICLLSAFAGVIETLAKEK